jgi:drug/metabolite transporter (DMT)-like permease
LSALVYSAVIASAILHALWNAILKRQEEPELTAAGMFVVSAVCGALAAVPVFGRAFPTLASGGWAAAAGLFEVGYIVSLSRALARAPLGPVYTFSRGGALVFVWPISVGLLGETVTPAALAGSALILVGLAATCLPGSSRPRAGGMLLAAVAAASIAGYHLCYKQSLALGGAPQAVFAVSMGVAGLLNVLRLSAAQRARLAHDLRRRAPVIVVAGIIMAASFLVFLFALVSGGAGAVLTLRNTSILFAQAMAWAIGERPTRAGVAGAVLVAGGAVMLGL